MIEPFQWRLKRLTITIIPTKGSSIFSVGKICIFLASKSPKPKSNKNFHFSRLLSGRLVSIHRKHQKFKNSFQRYLENPELFYSNFLYGSIYPYRNSHHKNKFFVKLQIWALGLNNSLKMGQNDQNNIFWFMNCNLIVYLFWHLFRYVNYCF